MDHIDLLIRFFSMNSQSGLGLPEVRFDVKYFALDICWIPITH
jgi:hypothetical protein